MATERPPFAGAFVLLGLLVAPLLAVMSLVLVTGESGRIQREDASWLLAALALALLAGLLLVASTFMSGGGNPGRGRVAGRLFVSGIVAAALAVALAIIPAAVHGSMESRPAIAGSLDGPPPILTAEVSASGLPVDGRLAVIADLQTIERGSGIDDRSPFSPRGSFPLERAYVGPDSDGDATHKFTVPVLANGPYTHVVVEATSGEGETPCIELPNPRTPGAQTACMFIPLSSVPSAG